MPIRELEHLSEAEYWIGDESDPLGIWWFSGSSGLLVPFASDPHSLQATLVAYSDVDTVIFTKNTGFVSGDGSGDGSDTADVPNLAVTWDVGSDLNLVQHEGRHLLTIVGTRVLDSRERTAQITLHMKARH